MGLAFIRKNTGQSYGNYNVGSYSSVHTLRAASLVILVHALWQVQGIDRMTAQELLEALDGDRLNDLQLDIYAQELTDQDLLALLVPDELSRLRPSYEVLNSIVTDHGGSPGEVFLHAMGSTVAAGSEAFNALVGGGKFIHFSDCDGTYSRGDVLDIVCFFDFIAESAKHLDPAWAERLQELRTFFGQAFNHGDVIIFA